MTKVHVVRVFPLTPEGGNPAPIVLDADDMSAEEMQGIAQRYGYESGFVLPPQNAGNADFRFRFFVPRHEMEMCAHATIAALWLLRQQGRLARETVFVETLSGLVEAYVSTNGHVEITQPRGTTELIAEGASSALLDVLDLGRTDLALPTILNASTSRVKTLVPLATRRTLDGLTPDFTRMERVCSEIGSTGLYPFAAGQTPDVFHARQFPRASGYPEDAATGIAAAALAFGLLEMGLVGDSSAVTIRQGEAMGHPSQIMVRFERSTRGVARCWIRGACLPGKLAPSPGGPSSR